MAVMRCRLSHPVGSDIFAILGKFDYCGEQDIREWGAAQILWTCSRIDSLGVYGFPLRSADRRFLSGRFQF